MVSFLTLKSIHEIMQSHQVAKLCYPMMKDQCEKRICHK